MNVLYLYIGDPAQPQDIFCQSEASKAGITVTTKAIPNKSGRFSLLLSALTIKLPNKKYDLVVTSEYLIGFAINLHLFLFRKKIKHIIYGINQSSRLLAFNNSLLNHLINKIFNQADLFVTHSRAEMQLFHKAHNIPIDKFVFSHWGFDIPDITKDMFANQEKDYLSFVGRNNRDLKTFCEAIKEVDINGVIITSAYNAPDFQLPENIEIYYDLDMDSCMSCLQHAKANVVLVNDDNRGAGHITIVAAMLMKKPQIISDVSVIKEYFIHGTHGISVPLHNSKSVQAAIKQLLDNKHDKNYGEQSYSYAKKYFTNDSVSKRFVYIMSSVMNNKRPETCNPNWLTEYTQLTQA